MMEGPNPLNCNMSVSKYAGRFRICLCWKFADGFKASENKAVEAHHRRHRKPELLFHSPLQAHVLCVKEKAVVVRDRSC